MARKFQIIPHIVQFQVEEIFPTPNRRISINSNTVLKRPYSCGFRYEAQQRAVEVKKIILQRTADRGYQLYSKVLEIPRMMQGRGYGIHNANLVPPTSSMSDILPAVFKVTRHMKCVPRPPPIIEGMEIIGRQMLPKIRKRPVSSPGTYRY